MADKLSISKERTAEIIKEYGKGENDSGNAAVQVAYQKIFSISALAKNNKRFPYSFSLNGHQRTSMSERSALLRRS